MEAAGSAETLVGVCTEEQIARGCRTAVGATLNMLVLLVL